MPYEEGVCIVSSFINGSFFSSCDLLIDHRNILHKLIYCYKVIFSIIEDNKFIDL